MLKISGEALQGPAGFGVDPAVLMRLAEEISGAVHKDIEVAVVVGGSGDQAMIAAAGVVQPESQLTSGFESAKMHTTSIR